MATAVVMYAVVVGLGSQAPGTGSGSAAAGMRPAAKPVVLTAKAAPTTPPRPAPSSPPAASPTPAAARATMAPLTRDAPAPAGTELATEAQCPGQESLAAAGTVLICLTSHARTFHGLAAVQANATLMQAAASKVADMVKCGFSHTACNRTATYWIDQGQYPGQCNGENIAAGQLAPQAVFVAWMNSPGHRANILNPSYRALGVAVESNSNGQPMWAMELGGC